MFCRDIMRSSVRTCHPSDTVARCADIMKEYDVGFVPVVDAHGKPVGVVTDRDIVLRVLAEKCTPRARVSRIMSENVVTCRLDDTLRVAEDRLARAQKSRIVVVDGEGGVVGVISLSDIGRVEESRRAGKLLRAIVRREAVEATDSTPARSAAPTEPHERSEEPRAEPRSSFDSQVCGPLASDGRPEDVEPT